MRKEIKGVKIKKAIEERGKELSQVPWGGRAAGTWRPGVQIKE